MITIILHGWGQSSKNWRFFVKQVGPDAQGIDFPGFGDEPLINPDWGVVEYANWVISKVPKNQKIILLGHSFGGRVAAEIASTNPKWLKGLILVAAPCIYRPSIKVKIKKRIYQFLKTIVPIKYHHFFYSYDLIHSKQIGMEKVFRKVVQYDQTDNLKKIAVPTLLIWGRNDSQVPVELAEEMQTIINNSELKIVENAGHDVYLDNSSYFFGLVNTFIKKLA
jgi:pimeloyl-ACP methyl ester carboxylesterase